MQPEHVCEFCSGAGIEFSPSAGPVDCLLCGGSGYATLLGDLGPTHSERRRPYAYSPGNRRLTLRGIGKRGSSYTVSEFEPAAGFAGRAFRLHKWGAAGEHYCCLVGAESASCDCAGSTYMNTAKANFRSYLRDDREFDSLGCKHLDALAVLLAGGWLDLPEHVPTHPTTDEE